MKKIKYVILISLLLFSFLWFKKRLDTYRYNLQNTVLFNDSYEGNFLAGYYAARNNDIDSSAKFFNILAKNYPDEAIFDNNSLMLNILNGDFELALNIARNREGEDYAIIAFDAIKNKNYKLAIEHFQKQLNNNKTGLNEFVTKLFINWCYVLDGDYDQALANIKSMKVENKDGYLLTLFQEAIIADLAGKESQASESYNELLTYTKSPLLTSLTANFYDRIGKTEEAKKLYLEYNQRNPLQKLFNSQLDEIEKGSISQAIIANPTDGLLLFISELNNMLLEQKNNQFSLLYARIAEYIDSTSPFSNYCLAQFYDADNDVIKSLEYYQKIDGNVFLYDSAKLKIAQILYNLGDISQSESLFSNIFAKNPDNFQNYLIYASLLNFSKNYEKSIDIYTSLINKIKDDNILWYIYYLRGSTYFLAGNNLLFEQDLTIAHNLNPQDLSVMNDLAYCLAISEKNLDFAMELINKSLASIPDNSEFLDTAGWLYYKKGDYKRAKEYLEKAIMISDKRSSNNIDDTGKSTLFDHLGDIYLAMGKKRLALFTWQYALESSKGEAALQISSKISKNQD